ncbi:hypothetical protein [Rhodanobacter sp. L36]|uniref:hypothetical protein n=1 Tax=Rhodanobacter sp. L36 TaxID=1747221 RepID=UPI00131E579A|nr:hypothetical protein [Rhodanobacter sp. L36]
MNNVRRHPVVFALIGVLALVGCSQQGSAPAPTAAQQQVKVSDADATRDLDTYRQLLRIHNDEMAVSLGKDIVSHYPTSAAAKEVQQTLPDIEKRYTENSEKNRLAAMWIYQVSPMAGGTQSTATIYAPGSDRVQLVLRRHTSWGQSAFLYGNGKFVCRGSGCAIAATVDGKPTHIKVFAPPTGEPALMMRDDSAFIAMLKHAKKISMDVTLVNGEKKETLVYEVGGFDPAKWAPVGKGKGNAGKGKKK